MLHSPLLWVYCCPEFLSGCKGCFFFCSVMSARPGGMPLNVDLKVSSGLYMRSYRAILQTSMRVKTHLNKLGLCMLYLWSLWTDVTDTDLWWEWNSYFKGSGHPKVIIQSLCRWSVVIHRKMFWIYTVARRWTVLLNNWTRRGIVLKHKIAPYLLCSAKSPEAPRS